MSELDEIGCAGVADVDAELALGVLPGRERARVLAHLDWCCACRENVGQLTITGEALLGMLPGIEPPLGFETAVMARTGLSRSAVHGWPIPAEPSWPPGLSPARHGLCPGRFARTGCSRSWCIWRRRSGSSPRRQHE